MEQYDPMVAPDPAAWQALDEDERLELVREYHRDQDEEIPNERLHATIHVVVESQLALDMEPVPETMDRLLDEGLDRHDAVHAIGAVLVEYVYGSLGDDDPEADLEAEYARRLERLTADRWRRGKW